MAARILLPALAFVVFLAYAPESNAGRPLLTAVSVPTSSEELGLEMQRIRTSGATSAYLLLRWRDVAPVQRPSGFTAPDPFDPAYNWTDFDSKVRTARQYGLQPVVLIHYAPDWAEGTVPGGPRYAGTVRPDPVEFGRFARAAALRYSGLSPDLPRVKFWQAWSEPNISLNFNPQFLNRRPYSPGHYRRMVNQFAAAVRSVHADNVVIAGGLAPFRDVNVKHTNWGPLDFMRSLLCVSPRLRSTCRTRVSFDIWSTHPFTSGGPTHSATLPDDVSLGDLHQVTRLLRAARRLGHIDYRGGSVRFWVTEFSWDTRPPDPQGVPTLLHRRWTAEALYRMWKAGVSFVSWTQLRDAPLRTSYLQSGLYYRGRSIASDRPKPSLQAFRFPFVAFPRGNRVFVWGRTPAGQRARVLLEQKVGSRWRRLGVVSTNGVGIFQQTLRTTSTRGYVRARALGSGAKAAPFSLARVPDRPFYPFGSPFVG